MKIAIMTQPLGRNYGGMMQAWALQQTLMRMGHDPVTMDRRSAEPGTAYKLARLAYRTAKRIAGRSNGPINIDQHMRAIFRETNQFVQQNIITSEPLFSTDDLKKHFSQHHYDAVIVGSDQTWRPAYSPNIYNFFLDFLDDKNIKRIAYASSFGVDNFEFSQEEQERCKPLAGMFDAISVREQSGVEICQKYLGVEAVHVLDPTLLLARADYQSLIAEAKLEENTKGVYTYFLDKTPEKLAFAQKISDRLGSPLFSTQAKASLESISSVSLEDLEMPHPIKWLSGFSTAKFVITDSFHGMVFALIFGKPFLAIKNASRGSARFDTLSQTFNCEASLLDESQLNEELDYNKCFSTYDSQSQLTSLSREWLQSNLHAKHENSN